MGSDRESDLRRMRALHRKVLVGLVRGCLAQADPDIREFVASLPDQVDSVEAYLKKFWARKGLGPGAVQDFAVRYGRALAGCTPFREFEASMEQLARRAGTADFEPELAAAAARHGVDAGSL